jgi:hypothetical protein
MLTTWKKLEAEITYLVKILRVGEELAASGLSSQVLGWGTSMTTCGFPYGGGVDVRAMS